MTATAVPCACDPEQWFARDSHADALAGCLRCPARDWCAREALRCRASWGLWAGIWIDGRHEDAAPYLHAIATEVRPAATQTSEGTDEPAADERVGQPLARPTGSPRVRPARTALLARSSGHCEVLAEGCRYTFDRTVPRRRSDPAVQTPTPPDVFAACTHCADVVMALDAGLAGRLGYVVEGHRDPAQVPFYWRASRWVLLDRDGWLTEISDPVTQIAV